MNELEYMYNLRKSLYKLFMPTKQQCQAIAGAWPNNITFDTKVVKALKQKKRKHPLIWKLFVELP